MRTFDTGQVLKRILPRPVGFALLLSNFNCAPKWGYYLQMATKKIRGGVMSPGLKAETQASAANAPSPPGKPPASRIEHGDINQCAGYQPSH